LRYITKYTGKRRFEWPKLKIRKALGERYDAAMLSIWVEGGREMKRIADALGLPKENAGDISDTYGLISRILLGA
jgi:hypothetical protein